MSYHDSEFDRLEVALCQLHAQLPEFRSLAVPVVEPEPVRRRNGVAPQQEGVQPVEVAQRLTNGVRNGGAASPTGESGRRPIWSVTRSGEWRCPRCGGIRAASCLRCRRCGTERPAHDVETQKVEVPR